MKTITFSNQKGGCAKTTSVWALGTGLNNKGYKVLLIDLDAQSNLSFTANVDLLNLNASLYDVFKGKASIEDAVNEIKPGLDIITGGLELAQADMEFVQQGREYMLRECLEVVQGVYDYCIIDTEPHLGILTANALTTSDSVIIPIQADVYGLQGVYNLKTFIDTTKKYSNPSLNIGGLLVTRVDTRTTLTQTLLPQIESTAQEIGTKVFDSKVRATVNIGETAFLQDDIYNVAPNGTATLDYLAFIDEFLKLF